MGNLAKPLASLSSGLLARKGDARPAMRRQMTLSEAGDDLGWNDMGDAVPVAQLHSISSAEHAVPIEPTPLPPVLIEREALAEEIKAPVASPATVKRTVANAKAAFTLRLDAERHLRLRLAVATRHRSAQQIVTEALDAFLETLPEVDALVRNLRPVPSDRLGN